MSHVETGVGRLRATASSRLSRHHRPIAAAASPSAHHLADIVAADPDPLAVLHGALDEWRSTIYACMANGDVVLTAPRTHLLVLGPSQGSGKTANVMVPSLLSHVGPAVSISTKRDTLGATALVRSRCGRVWHYGPDGGTVPGALELRFDPSLGCRDWGFAHSQAKLMVSATLSHNKGGATTDNSRHFAVRSAQLLAVMLFTADTEQRGIAWVVGIVNRIALKSEIAPVAKRLAERGDDAQARILGGVLATEDRERAAVFTTASTVLAAYNLPGALRSAEAPNFDQHYFVRGLESRYDTVYSTASAENQEMCAPLQIALLAAISRARYELHREFEDRGLADSWRATLFSIDELYAVALPDLPQLLADGGSQGVVVTASLQDLSQARARYAEVGKGFLSLFQQTIAFRGIRDRETLELLSLLGGTYDKPVWGGSESESRWGAKSWNATLNYQERKLLPPEQIYNGHPQSPDIVVYFPTQGWNWAWTTPYYRATPWPSLLVAEMERVAGAEASASHLLPLPQLDADGSGAHLRQWGLLDRYYAARAQIAEIAHGVRIDRAGDEDPGSEEEAS